MTRAEAVSELLKLVETYGMLWDKHIPQPAWDRMTRVAEVLTPEERRKALHTSHCLDMQHRGYGCVCSMADFNQVDFP